MLAQTFTAGKDGTLAYVQIVIGCDAGSPGTVTVELREVLPDGTPSATVLAALERPPDSFPAEAAIEDVAVSGAVITAGTDYALVIRATPDMACATRQGGGPMWHSPGVGDAFFDARPNPPGWLPLDGPFSGVGWLPFWIYVDTGPKGPRYCEFKDADGIDNDWLLADVPLCSCAIDPGLVAHRCWFVMPDFVLWRTLPLPLDQNGRPGEWNLLPMRPDLPAMTILEFDPDGNFSSEAVDFQAGLQPGKPTGRRVRYTGLAEQSEVLVVISGEQQPAMIRFETLLEIPESQ